jgi:segregation and condensation protein B
MSRPPDSPGPDAPDSAAKDAPAGSAADSVVEHDLWPPAADLSAAGEAPSTADRGPAPGVEVVDHGAPPSWAAEAASGSDSEAGSEALGPLFGDRLISVLESLLFASERPLTTQRIVELLEEMVAAPREASGPPAYQPGQIQDALAQLELSLRAGERGIELHQVAGGWQLRTAAQNAPWVQRLLQAKPVRLSRAQLETMAIVAYRQPVTRPEIDDIRGVDSGGALKTLLDRQMVRVLGKKEEPGRPLLYGTTREFLEFFNLRDLKDLPTLREYNELTDENREKMRELGHEPPLPGEAAAAIDPLVPLVPAVPPASEAASAGGEGGEGGAPAGSEAAAPADREPTADAAAPGGPFFSRRELIDQQLADDAEQLAKIDEMIRAVNTAFPLLDPSVAATLPDLIAPTLDEKARAAALAVAAEDEDDDEGGAGAKGVDPRDNDRGGPSRDDDDREPEEL